MSRQSSTSIFLDTSIQIARRVHSPEIKNAIQSRLKNQSQIESGLVVRQEFKRRLLKDAIYLLKQLGERGSFEKTMRHVSDNLPKPWARKSKMCLQMLMTVDETDEDSDRFDRARLFLRDLIKNGIATSEAGLVKLNRSTGCACALQPITEGKPFAKYELGSDRCKRMGGTCGIQAFLEQNRENLVRIRDYLASLPAEGPMGKSQELSRAERFIDRFLTQPQGIEEENPCLTVGDLLIALESFNCSIMYTMNAKESQHLTRSLGQSMLYRPANSDRPDVECLASDSQWPQF
ncbi:MAG: hypothetical protein ABSG31_18885 [Tepidisphaeraceae bacterium]|jgi:hypothetical protein